MDNFIDIIQENSLIYLMNPAKQIFLNAARQGRAVFIPVHVEDKLINTTTLSPIETKRTGDLSISIAKALKKKVPALITTLNSRPLIKGGSGDKTTRNSNFSAINNPKHSRFIQRNGSSVALISGTAAGLCVSFTIADCIERKITPIAVMDAINLPIEAVKATPDNYNEFRQAAASTWAPNVLTASHDEIIAWANEI